VIVHGSDCVGVSRVLCPGKNSTASTTLYIYLAYVTLVPPNNKDMTAGRIKLPTNVANVTMLLMILIV